MVKMPDVQTKSKKAAVGSTAARSLIDNMQEGESGRRKSAVEIQSESPLPKMVADVHDDDAGTGRPRCWHLLQSLHDLHLGLSHHQPRRCHLPFCTLWSAMMATELRLAAQSRRLSEPGLSCWESPR
jgi:hypothetical protein